MGNIFKKLTVFTASTDVLSYNIDALVSALCKHTQMVREMCNIIAKYAVSICCCMLWCVVLWCGVLYVVLWCVYVTRLYMCR